MLCEEPMSETNPLVKIKDSRKLIITPHIAWASVEARKPTDADHRRTDQRIF